jgi:hypothetical protein
MLVDNVGDMTITNDGATILSLLEVTHPAVSFWEPYRAYNAEMIGSNLGLTGYATGQGSRRWYHLGRHARFGTTEKSK